MGVSPVLATYVAWLCGPSFERDLESLNEHVALGKRRPSLSVFTAEARATRLAQEVGGRLPGTADIERDRHRTVRAVREAQRIVAPYVTEVVRFLIDFADPAPRERVMELPSDGGSVIRDASEPPSDADVVRATWASRAGAQYRHPDDSPGMICLSVGGCVVLYETVRRNPDLQGAAARVSSLVLAIANSALAADRQAISNACQTIDYVRMSDPDNPATSFRACVSLLEEMLAL